MSETLFINLTTRDHERRTINAAQFRLSSDLLCQLLLLPEGSEITGIQMHPYEPFTIQITASHPDLPAVAEGDRFPEISPSYRQTLKDGEHYVPEFVQWDSNIPKRGGE
jgi:hypothetical protein